ncbi:ATP-binding cassette domain-containing protein [Paenibacillus aquistagni]|nr:ATP-binding cassette domain-containing protein [Paenibacillus aquistagni]
MIMLELNQISKSYKLADNQVFPALRDINISFKKGELVSIIGESGSGKSTLMNLIGGLDSDFTGKLLIEGRNIGEFSSKELDAYRKNKVGFVFQSFNLIPHLSVLDNVTIAMTLSNIGKSARVARAEEILTEVGLKDHMKKKPNQLSGGQKQRVAIARALINDPDIIIADEPTGSLDSETTEQILELITNIARKGKLVIMVTHSEKVANHSSRVVKIADGRIVDDIQGMDIGSAASERASINKGKQNLSMLSAIKLALNNMKEKMTRNVLIAIGASIGITSVILMLALGNGVKGYVTDQMNSMTNPLVVEVNMPIEEEAAMNQNEKGTAEAPPGMPPMDPSAMFGSYTPFEQKDMDKLSDIDHVVEVQKGLNIMALGTNMIQYEDKTSQILMVSTLSENVTESNIAKGAYPEKGEILVSEAVEKDLGQDIIGKEVTVTLKLNEETYQAPLTVSGIYTTGSNFEGTSNMQIMFANYDDLVAIGDKHDFEIQPSTLYLISDDVDHTDSIRQAVADLGYRGSAQEMMADMFLSMLDMLSYVLAAIAAISLIVSAIMILVVLYISVVERTKEIGVLKAIGARSKDIRRIFVSESFLIGLLSGLMGILFALLAMMIVNPITTNLFSFNLVVIEPIYMIAGIVISVLISMAAGIIPAGMAAKLDPVESLRRE